MNNNHTKNNKVPYHIVALKVEELYAVDIPDDDDQAIEEQCQRIAAYIQACGYTEEEYMERWVQSNEN